MNRIALAAVLAASAGGVLAQAVPDGTYQFISGPGLGNPPFTVTGGIPAPGGSVVGAHLPFCSGLHVHGVFNGFADPAGGGCGHGIISLIVAPPSVSGGGLPGGAPNNVAGQLALTSPIRGLAVDRAGDAFVNAVIGFAQTTDALLDVALNDESKVWDKDAFNISWNSDDSEVTFTFREERSLPTDRDSERTPDYLVQLNPSGTDRTRDQAGTGGTGYFKLADGAFDTPLRTTIVQPAAQVLTSPSTLSWLEEFAAYDDQSADGYRRDADKTRQQAEEWRKLADDARNQAERNRQRADDARRDGRENDARDWEKEAERDQARAGERDAEARRLDRWSDEARRREQAARDQAQERRDAAERAREQARQAERDRAERVRREAEEKARAAREAREARQAQERAEREARIRELEDRVRAREAERARARAAAEREHRAWLDQQQRERDARARGGFTDADANAAAARKKKKEEEEGRTWADFVVEYADSAANWVKDKLTGKVEDEIKDTLKERSGFNAAVDNLGLDKSLGAVSDGIDKIKAVKKLGDSMEAELRRQPGLRDRIENRMEQWSSARPHMEYSQKSNRDMQRGESGNLYGKEMFGTVSRMVEANR